MQYLTGSFNSKKQFKTLVLHLLSILAYFEHKVAKNMFFCDFLKNGDFWSKSNISNVFLVKFPFKQCNFYIGLL